MFNTLELVSSLAIQRRTDDTVQVIEDLGKMMRFSINTNDDRVPLTEELDYVQRYISILQTRFGHKLDISVTLEGTLNSVVIIKFILQPLIENAVKYSFQHQTTAQVQIRINRMYDRLHISVSDNGPGIPAEIINKLQHPVAPSSLESILHNGGWHIGLGNVIARCRLHYGGLFTVHMENDENGGACIELTLPVQEEYDVQRINRR